MGASIADFAQPGESIQRKQRDYRSFTDQHGRTFEAQVDVRNGMPIGEFTPRGCNPPWLPSMRYARFRKDHQITFAWDYDPLANELSGDTAQYYKDARTMAMREKLPIPDVGGLVDPLIRDVFGRPPLSPLIPLACAAGDPWILGMPGAVDTLGLAEILEQGTTANAKHVMDTIRKGLAGKVTEHAVSLVPEIPQAPEKTERKRTINDADEDAVHEPVTYRQFVAACSKRGMKMPDIVAAWHAQKLLQAPE